MNTLKLKEDLKRFLKEDIGEGDLTSDSIFPQDADGKVSFIAKEAGTFCGADIIKTGFELLNPKITTEVFVKDGEPIEEGKQIATGSGRISDLLKGERVILNLLQRMSGIATLTRQAVDMLDSSHTRICDTRKTTPGLRMLEKYAVRCGGGYNHRLGLYDGVMIKDNHISFAGSIKKAMELVRGQVGHMVKIEVETESREQVTEAAEAGANIIMFDNCTPDEIKELIESVPDSIVTEASGGIQLHNLASYRHTGVDYISLGFLTHSYRSLDISVKVATDENKMDGEE